MQIFIDQNPQIRRLLWVKTQLLDPKSGADRYLGEPELRFR